jgi:hypothetical protein
MFQHLFTDGEIDAALIDAAIGDYSKADDRGYAFRVVVKGWDALKSISAGDDIVIAPLGNVSILKNTYKWEDYDSTANGGEDFEIVLQVEGDTRFFKKEGHFDSYGEVAWLSGVKRTVGKTKTITVFE